MWISKNSQFLHWISDLARQSHAYKYVSIVKTGFTQEILFVQSQNSDAGIDII